jgi:aspartate-semialdehyde dehydrogenase
VRVVIVGATGAVGTEILKILEQRGTEADFVAVASERSAGRKLPFRGGHLEVVALTPEVFDDADIALFDVPDDVSLAWAEQATDRGAIVVDNSAAYRMHPDVPLVVPEINPDEVKVLSKGIIASANCTTLAMVVPLAALHAHVPVTRVIAASYQAASGSGQGGIDELWDQTELAAKQGDQIRAGLGRDVLEAGDVFTHPLALNVIPQAGSFGDGGYTSEELKLCQETRKIMGLPDLKVTATCVRVPVMVGHGVAVHAEFAGRISVDDARGILRDAPGVELVDDPDTFTFPTPLLAAGNDPCYVGRLRQDHFDDAALEMFCVADNLRKGAALNTVQIAELLLAEG